MIGFASFAAIGGMLHAWQHTPGSRYNPRAANWSFWLMNVGLILMFADLTAAGLVQGVLWQTDASWMESIRASHGYWLARSITGLVLLAGFGALALAMLTGPVGEPAEAPVSSERADVDHLAAWPAPEGARERRLDWLKCAYVSTVIAGVGFFLFSFVVLGVWPNQVLERRIAAERPRDLSAPAADVLRGRAVYGREGCAFCHTQFVRFTESDVRRFGPPSRAWESDRDYPQLWGTRRIGPDLARESGRRTHDWHLTHLWNPRSVTPDSNMPAYPWLFNGSPRTPTREALDLVAYLDSLGRSAWLAGGGRQSNALQLSPDAEEWCGLGTSVAVFQASSPAPMFDLPRAGLQLEALKRRGAELFAHNCRGCHGPAGRGDDLAAASLLPAPRDLTSARFAMRRLSQSLWSGVPGSSMPGWNDLSVGELRSLVAFLRSLEPDEVRLPAPLSALAQSLYARNCVICHGADGGGTGLAARVLTPAPTDFRHVQPSVAYAEQAIARGVPGTAMPPWEGKLSPAERHALVRYVQSFYQPELPANE